MLANLNISAVSAKEPQRKDKFAASSRNNKFKKGNKNT